MKSFLESSLFLVLITQILYSQTTHDVIVQNFSFSPDSITIEIGDTVRWTNVSGTHNVVAYDGSFSSGPPAPAPWVYTHTFNSTAVGDNPYYCEPHQSMGMTGTIIVEGLKITSPNGGENWVVGTNQNITWLSVVVNNVKIEYTTDGGSNWITIISSTPSDGSYDWNIPNTPSNSCLVKISDVLNSATNDQSNNPFSVVQPSITVFTPNGGESYEGTTIASISYSSVAVNIVRIEFSSDAGISWVIIYPSEPPSGTIGWVIPNISSANCLIKVTDMEDLNNYDVSDNVFSITEVGWYQQNSNVSSSLNSIDMWNNSVGYTCGDNGKITTTSDGGQYWESLSTGIVEDLNSLKFVTENTGWVVGDNGRILKTTNGGLSWSYQSSNTTNSLLSVYFINQSTGWVVGLNGTVRKTSDSGYDWITQQSNVNASLNSVHFYSSSLGWIVGNSGTYLKTTNGGDTWIQKTV